MLEYIIKTNSKVFLVLTFSHNIGTKNKLYGYFKHHKYVQKIYYLGPRGNFLAMKYRLQIVSQKNKKYRQQTVWP